MIEVRTDPNQAGSKPIFQADEYLHFLADVDWTEVQKREFIGALWQIVTSFVDLGFGLHPLQNILEAKPLELDSADVLALSEVPTDREKEHDRNSQLAAIRGNES